MILLGVIINGISIVFGSVIGLWCENISEKTKQTVLHIIAIIVIVLGIQMAFESEQLIFVLISLIMGGVIGEVIHIEAKMYHFVNKVGIKLNKSNKSNITESFITASIFYLAGAMSIIGPLDSGLRNDHTLLFTKAVMDGISAIFLTAAIGRGVIFSAPFVFLFQGTIVLFSSQIIHYIPKELLDQLIIEITGTGGILIIAVGLNLLEITQIRVPNLLPGLGLIILFIVCTYYV